ncbi:hypothetical protein LJC17_05170 [Acholeplasma sp. OttesenSCG-928-E16]|nr:hypothetical protein [Acholeplasma sp. OttesenSCG-928-E16]
MNDHELVEIGLKFIKGDGVPSDKKRGISYLEQAATNNSKEAKIALVRIYFQDAFYQKSIEIYESLSKRDQETSLDATFYYLSACLQVSLNKPKKAKDFIHKFKDMPFKTGDEYYVLSKFYSIKKVLDTDERKKLLLKAFELGHTDFTEEEYFLVESLGTTTSFLKAKEEFKRFFPNLEDVHRLEKNKTELFAKEVALSYIENHPEKFEKRNIKKILNGKIVLSFYSEYQPLVIFLSEINGITIQYSYVMGGELYKQIATRPSYNGIKEEKFLFFNRGKLWIDEIVNNAMDENVSSADLADKYRYILPNMKEFIAKITKDARNNLLFQVAKEVASNDVKHPTILSANSNHVREWQVGYFIPFYFLTFKTKKGTYTVRISASYEATDCFINNKFGLEI